MSRTVSVTNSSAALAAVENPGFFALSIRKDAKTGRPKEYNGALFLTATYTTADGRKTDGWFTLAQDVPLNRGLADPADVNDTRNKWEATRFKLETTRSLAGDFGQFLDKLNPIYNAEVQRLAQEHPDQELAMKIQPLMKYTLSRTNATNPNGPIEDPLIYFKMMKGNYPGTFPISFLRNTPKCVILDASKVIEGPDGKARYGQATIDDGSGNEIPVTVDNAYKFIVDGAVLKAGSRVYMPSAVRSSGGVSMPIELVYAIVEIKQGGGWEDEDAYAPTLPAKSDVATSETTPAVAPTVATPAVESVTPAIDPAVDDAAAAAVASAVNEVLGTADGIAALKF